MAEPTKAELQRRINEVERDARMLSAEVQNALAFHGPLRASAGERAYDHLERIQRLGVLGYATEES